MKNKNKGILLALVAVIAIGSIFSWYSAHRVDARYLAIFHIFIQAVDSETKENLSVTVQSPTPELSQVTGTNGQGPVPMLLEMMPDGLVRMAWVDLQNSEASVVLKAEGYKPLWLPSNLIGKTKNFDSLAGSRVPDKIELQKTQPDGIVNASASRD